MNTPIQSDVARRLPVRRTRTAPTGRVRPSQRLPMFPVRLIYILAALLMTAGGRVAADSHPLIQRLVESSDVIVVGTVKDPLVWFTSELIILTGTGEALVERPLLQDDGQIKEGQKLEFRVVHNLDLDFDDLPQAAAQEEKKTAEGGQPNEAGPDSPGKQRLIVFLKRDGKGTLYAEDGFLFTLPHDGSLERLVRHRIASLAEKGKLD